MTETKSFVIGRTKEIESFITLTQGKTRYSLLNIYGTGGIGKTVLGQKMQEFATQNKIPFAFIEGNRPDLTPVRILHIIKVDLSKTGFPASFFGSFEREYEVYLAVQEVLGRSGGIQTMFGIKGLAQDPDRYGKIIQTLDISNEIVEDIQQIISNRFVLERYLRRTEKNLVLRLAENIVNAIQHTHLTPVILFDTYEELEGLDDWICRELVPNLPNGMKIVILGRNSLLKVNLDWNGMGNELLSVELDELPEIDAKAYLAHFGLCEPTALDQIYRFTGGYPLLLVLARYLAQQAGGWDKIDGLQNLSTRDQIASQLLQRILREESAIGVQAFLEKGVIARWFTPEIISVILQINPEEARSIYDRLSRHSFVERHEYGLKFHDKIRELLLDRLKFTSKVEYDKLVKKLTAYYRLQAGLGQEDDSQVINSHRIIEVETVGQDSVSIATAEAISLAEILAFGSDNAVDVCNNFVNLLHVPRLIHNAPYRNDVYPTIIDVSSITERIPTGLPLFFIRASSFWAMSIDELRRYIQEIAKPPQYIFVFIYWEKRNLSEKQEEASAILEKLERVWAHDCVVFGPDEIHSIAFSPDPRAMFCKILLSQIKLNNISPYVKVGPTSPEMFFGREKELREIVDHIKFSSYAIVGGRRIGKSSLLHRLHSVHLPAAGYYTVLHSCEVTPTYETFLTARIHNWKPEAPPSAPKVLNELLNSNLGDPKIVMLLDEVDKLIPNSSVHDWRIFSLLRALSDSGRLQVVFSGERNLRDARTDVKSPLFNFVNEILLGPLDYPSVYELITHPMKQLEIKLIDENTIVQSIYNNTSGHPNIIQRLCHRLIKQLDERGARQITNDDVISVINDPVFQREDFLSTYWQAATHLEKIISLLIADDENICTLKKIRTALSDRCNLHPKTRSIDDALQSLVDLRSILKRTPLGYTFAVKAFPRVVKNTLTFHDQIEVLIEEYQEQNE